MLLLRDGKLAALFVCVGKLREIPGVFSQGKTLKENIIDAYRMMLASSGEEERFCYSSG